MGTDRDLTWQTAIALLGLCMLVGVGLRFFDLGGLPPWTDETATLAFSLGNGFQDVPLDRFISWETLMAPLRPNPQAEFGDVTASLFSESTHPPIYFLLTHAWLQLFPAQEGARAGLVSIWGARSLSALLGVLAIPATFFVGWDVWRSRRAALGGAALMAVSPLGIFLARDARHYTLAILLVLASLACFSAAVRAIAARRPFPIGLGLGWVAINSLGMATHFFFVFSLVAQGVALLDLARSQWPKLGNRAWQRLYWTALGTALGAAAWLVLLEKIQSSPATSWAYKSNDGLLYQPLEFLQWLITAVVVSPWPPLVPPPIGIAIGSLILAFLVWGLPRLWRALRAPSPHNPALRAWGIYAIALPLLFLGITFTIGPNLMAVPRFNFPWLPGALVLLGGALTRLPRREVMVFLSVACLSGLMAATNISYLYNHRPDLVAPDIQDGMRMASHADASAFVMLHRHHGQTGRLMGLIWALGKDARNAEFLLVTGAEEDPELALAKLKQNLETLPRPVDVWLVNFPLGRDRDGELGCQRNETYRDRIGEYRYRLYHC